MPAQLENWFLRKPMQKMAPLFPERSLSFESRKSGKVVATLVTDEEGVATSGDIPIATYKDGKMKKEIEYILVETKAPEGYVRSEKEENVVFEYKDDKTKEIEITKELTNERIPTGGYVKSPKTGITPTSGFQSFFLFYPLEE